MKRWLLVTVSMLVLVGFCDDAEIVKVRGRGTGMNKTEALEDAYRDAIESAVGVYVDAEQMVKNEDLVKDQILTHSNAYIKDYETIKEDKSGNGLVTITILANVRKLALAKKIKDVMPTQKVALSNVSKNLHAEIVTDTKRKEGAVALLKNELDNLSPIRQLMKVSLAAEKPVTESVPEDSSLVRLWYPIKVEVDRTRYYEEFVPRWERLLDEIKIAPAKRLALKNELSLVKAYDAYIDKEFGVKRKGKSGVMTRCEDKSDDEWVFWTDGYPLYKMGMALNEEYKGICFLSTIINGKSFILHGVGCCDDGDFYEKIDHEAFCKKERFVMRIFVDETRRNRSNPTPLATIPEDYDFGVALVRSARGNMLSGNLYKLSYDCNSEIVNWQNKCIFVNGKIDKESLKMTTYDLCFLDANGEEVVGTTFVVKNIDVSSLACVVLDDGGSPEYTRSHKNIWLITPLVGGVAKSYIKWVSVDVPKDDVANIATASISVEE